LFSFSSAKLHAVRRTYGVIVLGILACLGAAGIVSCRAIREPWRWRIVLRLQAAVAIAPLVAFLVATTDPVPTSPPSLVRMVLGLWAIGILATVVAGAWDLVQRAKYDLVHYAGIVVPAVMLVHPVVTRWLAEWWP
jgi:hypothetical protein